MGFVGKDVIVQAQTKTKKFSAIFTLPCLKKIDIEIKQCQALILAPNRELAIQIQKFVMEMGQYMKGLEIRGCISEPIPENMASFEAGTGCHIVVGTPDLVHDMVKNEALRIDNLKLIVLDEMDEMLGRRLVGQVEDILQLAPQPTQVVLSSVTMPQGVLDITTKFMRNPVSISKQEELTLVGMRQFYISVEKEESKLDILFEFFELGIIAETARALIFCNTCEKVDFLTKKLTADGLTIFAIHGDMDQSERDLSMEQSRSDAPGIFIATDILARDIEVQKAPLVINYDLPTNKENYIHHIRRDGIVDGTAINIVTATDVTMLHDIEQFYTTHMEETSM
ncbi:hypothetical protein ABW20_dc0107154 [Dactylellina cionopaga]|nr:hypothetical protein ABW20_dc0107154 [Dactylellina cionopaga]